MAYRNLDEFLIRLEQAGELIHIEDPVSTDMEIARLTACMTEKPATENKALWFDSVIGSDFPVVTNLFGTETRMAWALGLDTVEEIEQRVRELIDIDFSQGMGALLSRAGTIMSAIRSISMGGNWQGKAPVQEVRHTTDIDLLKLPVLRNWPGEVYPTITSAQIIIYDAERNTRRAFTAPLVVCDGQTLGLPNEMAPIDISPEGVAIAIVLGSDPAAIWSTTVPLPPQIDPYWLAGWLRGRPVPFVQAVTQNMRVPADAEFIIEGRIQPEADSVSRVAGQHGFYIGQKRITKIRVTGMTHRENAIFPASSCIPIEAKWPQKATERFFVPVLRTIHNDVCDLSLPLAGAPQNLAIASIKKHYLGQVQKVMYGLWGLGELALNKSLVIVDDDVNIHDIAAVLQAVMAHVNWRRDITLVQGPLTINDDSLQTPGFGYKIGIDATRKVPESIRPTRPIPDLETIKVIAGENWKLWCNAVLVVATDAPTVDELHKQMADLRALYPDQHLIFVDQPVDMSDLVTILNYVLASVDWERDMLIEASDTGHRVVLNAVRRIHKLPPALTFDGGSEDTTTDPSFTED